MKYWSARRTRCDWSTLSPGRPSSPTRRWHSRGCRCTRWIPSPHSARCSAGSPGQPDGKKQAHSIKSSGWWEWRSSPNGAWSWIYRRSMILRLSGRSNFSSFPNLGTHFPGSDFLRKFWALRSWNPCLWPWWAIGSLQWTISSRRWWGRRWGSQLLMNACCFGSWFWGFWFRTFIFYENRVKLFFFKCFPFIIWYRKSKGLIFTICFSSLQKKIALYIDRIFIFWGSCRLPSECPQEWPE